MQKTSGLEDPLKLMTSEELQKTINENLKLTGKEGRFRLPLLGKE